MLTEKQKQFAECIVSGKTARESYTTVYDTSTNCSTQTIDTEAYKLTHNPEVKEYIDHLRAPLVKQATTQAIASRKEKRAIAWEGVKRCIDKGDEAGASRWMDIINKMDAEYVQISKDITERPPLDNIDTDTLLKLA